jgi:hypothetical protein
MVRYDDQRLVQTDISGTSYFNFEKDLLNESIEDSVQKLSSLTHDSRTRRLDLDCPTNGSKNSEQSETYQN